jgi:TonB-dependent SusC/RagA subfamily outer membrane receptor
MKSVPAFIFALLVASTAYSQTRVVSGELSVFNQYPVANVEVASKKAKSTVMTDAEGRFELVCNEKDVVLVKGKVFQPLSKRVGKNDDFIAANLIFNDSPVNREIATGMGYISAENLNFALAHLQDENNDFCNYPDVFSLIRGKFTGVEIKASASGGQGIYIRGQKSLIEDNEAIYIVNGVRVSDVSFVVPCEMSSIDFLKDGGAAMYGSQAANGVVVIETKGNRH